MNTDIYLGPAPAVLENEKRLSVSLSYARLFATPWTVAHQAPLSMRFSRQEYWIGLPFPSPITVRFWTKPDFPKLNLEMVDLKKYIFL